MEQAESDAAGIIRSLIELQISEEQGRRSSLEQRAMAVITASGILVTLITGIIGVVDRVSNFKHEPASAALTIGSLCTFIMAAVWAIAVNAPRGHRVVGIDAPDGLASMVRRDKFRSPRAAGERRIAEVRLEQLRSLRRANAAKATALFMALASEVAALALLVTGVLLLII